MAHRCHGRPQPLDPRSPRSDDRHAPRAPRRRHRRIAERLLTTQSPQRPQVAPAFTIEIDGRTLTGREGQTILEVCRDNGIEVPDPLLRAQAAGLRRLPHVRGRGRGRGHAAHQLLARRRAGDGRAHPDAAPAPGPQDQPGADLQRPQRLLPAALPEQVPQPHRHPGLPEGQHRRRLRRVDAHLQAHHPLPQRARPRLPGALRGALPARRGRGGDRHPRQPSLRRRPGAQGAGAGHEGARARSRSSRVAASAPRSSARARRAWRPPTTSPSPATR